MRRVPAIVWVLVGLNAALLGIYALLLPPYTGFDEPQHVDMVVHVADGDTWPWPAPGTLLLTAGVANSSNPVYFGPLTAQPYTDDAYPDRGDRKTLRELGGLGPTSTLNYPNQMVQHPPGYYALGAVLLKAWPGSVGDLPYDRVVGLLRLLSIVLVAPLPLLVWHAVRRLAPPSTAVAGAALSLAVPGLTRVGANVQNDDLLILACSALLVALVRVATGDLSRRTAVAVGLLTGLCLLTKGFALALPPVVVAAYAVHRRGWQLPWKPLAWALGVGGVLGGPWYLMNIVRFGHIQTEGLGKLADAQFRGPAKPGSRPLSTYVSEVSRTLNRRFWGAIGTPDSPCLPPALCWLLTAAVVALVVVALVRSRGRRGALGMLLLPLPLMLGLVVAGSLHWYRFNGRLIGVQGRYLYPAVLGVLVVTALGLGAVVRTRRNLAPLIGVLVALGLQLWALQLMLRTYWIPGHDVHAGLSGVLHWSPWPPVLTVIPFLAAPALGLWALVLVSKKAFSAEPAPQPA